MEGHRCRSNKITVETAKLAVTQRCFDVQKWTRTSSRDTYVRGNHTKVRLPKMPRGPGIGEFSALTPQHGETSKKGRW